MITECKRKFSAETMKQASFFKLSPKVNFVAYSARVLNFGISTVTCECVRGLWALFFCMFIITKQLLSRKAIKQRLHCY